MNQKRAIPTMTIYLHTICKNLLQTSMQKTLLKRFWKMDENVTYSRQFSWTPCMFPWLYEALTIFLNSFQSLKRVKKMFVDNVNFHVLSVFCTPTTTWSSSRSGTPTSSTGRNQVMSFSFFFNSYIFSPSLPHFLNLFLLSLYSNLYLSFCRWCYCKSYYH